MKEHGCVGWWGGGAGWNSWDEERYGVPRIANINKLDILAASVKKTLASIEKRLTVQPLVTQIV